jgi:hypothetical protein
VRANRECVCGEGGHHSAAHSSSSYPSVSAACVQITHRDSLTLTDTHASHAHFGRERKILDDFPTISSA